MSGMSSTVLRDGRLGDWNYIDSLRKQEGSALGFIPKDAYLSVLEGRRIANRSRFEYQRILVTEDNGDLTGFCYASFASDWASIIQIVVQRDARRWHRAALMADEIEQEALKRGNVGIKCRVALDLESNWFWRALGYNPYRIVVSTWLNQRQSKSNRPIVLYEKPLSALLGGLEGRILPVEMQTSLFGKRQAAGLTGILVR
jgi:hypothetical protein